MDNAQSIMYFLSLNNAKLRPTGMQNSLWMAHRQIPLYPMRR